MSHLQLSLLLHDYDDKGLIISPEVTGNDTVPVAIVRELQDDVDEVDSGCKAECRKAKQTLDRVIEAAPEYLRIQLRLEGWNENKGVPFKNTKPVDIPEILDLTAHMDQTEDLEPVRYRLLHVVYHQGSSIRGGHYTTGVTSAHTKHAGFLGEGNTRPDPPQWFCNDSAVREMEDVDGGHVLTDNPVNWSNKDMSESDYNARTLWYVREPAPAKERERVEEHEPADVGGIAKRVTSRPRQNRGKRVAV